MTGEQISLLAFIAVLSFVLSFIGSAVGLILGHVRLPLLIYYFRLVFRPLDPENPASVLAAGKTALAAGTAANLIISGTGALAGSIKHLRDGRVSWHCLALMGTPSVVGAMLAAWLFHRHVDHFWSSSIIGVMLVISGLGLVQKSPGPESCGELSLPLRVGLEMVLGLGLGALAAITGLMLGSLRLPMMIRLLKLDPGVAVGSNMAIGCLTGLTAAATSFLAHGSEVDWTAVGTVLGVVVLPTVLGGYLGGWLTGRIHKDTVRRLAGWIIAVTGVLMVGQGIWPHLRPPRGPIPDLIEEQHDEDDWGDPDDD